MKLSKIQPFHLFSMNIVIFISTIIFVPLLDLYRPGDVYLYTVLGMISISILAITQSVIFKQKGFGIWILLHSLLIAILFFLLTIIITGISS